MRSPSHAYPFHNALFCVILILVCILWLCRAPFSINLWLDEYYSLRIMSFPTSVLIETTKFDAHPPLYYLLLKGVKTLCQAVGLEASVFWLRLPGLLMQLFTLVASRWLLRQLEFTSGQVLFLISLVAFCPYFANSAAELRNYSVVINLIELGFLIFLLTVHGRARFTLKEQLGWWLTYALLMALGLWLHLLCAIVTFLLGVLWIVVVCWDRFSNRRFLLFGAGAQFLILLLFFPWLMVLQNQTDYLQSTTHSWMSPPDLLHFSYCLYANIIFAKWGWEILGYQGELELVILVSTFALLLPWLGVIIMIPRMLFNSATQAEPLKNVKRLRFRGFVYFSALGVWLGFLLITWLLANFKIMQVFHVNRYQAMVHGPALLLFGLGILELVRIHKWLPTIAGSLLFSAFLFCQFQPMLNPTFASLMYDFVKKIEFQYPPAGSTIVVYPEELIPVLPTPEGVYSLITIKQFLAQNEYPETSYIYYFPTWNFAYESQMYFDQYLLNLVNDRRGEILNHASFHLLKYYKIQNWSAEDSQNILTKKSLNPYPVIPETALRSVFADELPFNPLWFELLYDQYLNCSRWGGNGNLPIPVNPPLLPGNYSFNLVGVRMKQTGTENLTITFPWKTEIISTTDPKINLTINFQVPEGQTLSTIYLHAPASTPKIEGLNPQDNRMLSFCYNGSWITPAK